MFYFQRVCCTTFFCAFGSKLTYLSVLVQICAFPNPASMESLQHSNVIDDMIDMMLQFYR
jgi:hypothetical protein